MLKDPPGARAAGSPPLHAVWGLLLGSPLEFGVSVASQCQEFHPYGFLSAQMCCFLGHHRRCSCYTSHGRGLVGQHLTDRNYFSSL